VVVVETTKLSTFFENFIANKCIRIIFGH